MRFSLKILVLVFICCFAQSKTITKQLRIRNGKIADPAVLKYIVSIRNKTAVRLESFGKGFICGGALIATRAVLTAAKCFRIYNKNFTIENYYPAKVIEVVMGNIFIEQRNGTIIRNVKEIVYNKQKEYDSYYDVADIAILILSKKVSTCDDTRFHPIELRKENVTANILCEMSGWGKNDSSPNATFLGVLHTIEVRIVKKEICAHYLKLTPGTICGNDNSTIRKDFCRGDEGGPLVCNNILSGIASDSDCGKFPVALYTDIVAYGEWISKTLQGKKIKFCSDIYGAASSKVQFNSIAPLMSTLWFILNFLH